MAASYRSGTQISVIVLTEHNAKEYSIQYWQNLLLLSPSTEATATSSIPYSEGYPWGSEINWSFCKTTHFNAVSPWVF